MELRADGSEPCGAAKTLGPQSIHQPHHTSPLQAAPVPTSQWGLEASWCRGLQFGPFSTHFHLPPPCLARLRPSTGGGTGSHRCPASSWQPGAGGEGSPGTAVREERNKADPFSNPHRICRPVRGEGGFQPPFWCDFMQKRGRGRPTPDGGKRQLLLAPISEALRGAPCPARRELGRLRGTARLGGWMNGALRLLGGEAAAGVFTEATRVFGRNVREADNRLFGSTGQKSRSCLGIRIQEGGKKSI